MKAIYPLAGTAFLAASAFSQELPNILIIQCDHLTQRVVGAYGETQGITPIIDKVASQGVVFSNAYVGCPLSQPSRTALWSGMMPHQTNVRSNSHSPINPELPETIPTLGSLFTENGYEAMHFGKTHAMGALRGFIHKEPEAKPFEDSDFPVNKDSFLDVGTCEDAVNYLKNPPENPFICIVDFQNPHNICGFVGENSGSETNLLFNNSLPELPANFEVKDWSLIPVPVQYICCSHRRMTQAAVWDELTYRHYIAAFQHYTRMVDRQIGQVLEALYVTQAGENTIIVILADHGDGMASHQMVTKHISFYEEITNIPFIIAGPGIHKQNQKIDSILIQPTIDLLPTLCELANIKVPEDKPGISLAPLLTGGKQTDIHPYVVSEWHSEYEMIVSPGRMIRSQRYKYMHYLEREGEELYDLENDPGEMDNLAYKPEYENVIKEHRDMLDDYIQRTDDDYRSLQIKADARCRSHKPGYPNHIGPDIRELLKEK